ncbi:MAG: aldehyde dehydrogenase family protein [Candidatus Methanomethyliales bacterium]|nr:aldehyde dehydrogenase family protein [Candidatus Methanomethylicales archaeon]
MRICPSFAGTLDTAVRVSGDLEVEEISEFGVQQLFSKAPDIQRKLSELNIDDRIQVFEEMGKIWEERLRKGQLDALKMTLSESTGYSDSLIEQELSLVCSVFDGESLRRSLEASLGNTETLCKFVEISRGEYKRYFPAGPVFIISSGNSLIPPLIPTTISLLTGNMTILRPSISNYNGVIEVYNILRTMNSEKAKLMSEGLAISYFTHDSPTLKYLLTKARVGVVNFWGGDPARLEVSKLVSENPHRPRLIVNGPLTGFVIVDEDSVDEMVADGLAKNVVLYDQQLCSSPTSAVFIGSFEKAKEFANHMVASLNKYGSIFKTKLSEGQIYLIQSARRIFQIKGSLVYSSNDPQNMWTLVLSKGKRVLDEVVSTVTGFNIYFRRRFIEIVVVDNWHDAPTFIKELPYSKAFRGVDKVQTVGLAVSDKIKQDILEDLVNCGVYRIVPVADMYLRSPLEPYDGLNIPSSFTYIVYMRDRALDFNVS